MRRLTSFPGVAVAAVIAALATELARFAPILGAPVIAIVLGVAVCNLVSIPAALDDGIRFSARSILQGAVIVSGFGISLASIVQTGLGTLPVTLGTMAIVLGLAPWLGSAFGLDLRLRQLIAIGTAICGASAIAAASTVLESSEEDTALAISVIFLYNIVAVMTFPLLGHAMAMSQAQFGVWAGTAINDTSSVVAAGFSYGHDAGVHATIVKLTRSTLILPIVGVIALWRALAERNTGTPVPWRRIVPWFIVWFLLAALVNTLGGVPLAVHGVLAELATFLICTALAAIGLQTTLRTLLRVGSKPLLFGFALWITIATSSLVFQRLTGT